MAISDADKSFLVSLYVGYFNRAPDPAGLQYWIDQVEAGRDTNTIAADFAASPEAKALYPFLTTPDVSSPTSFITSVYQNLFNRAPDAAGLAFWEGQLSAGTVSAADMIDAIIKGATTAPDSTIMNNKVEVGLDFATDAGNSAGFTYNDEAASAATNAISGVTDDAATVAAAKSTTDAFIAGGGGAPATTHTLTTGADAVVGGTGTDTITAADVAAGKTFTVGDSIDGGAGNDTMNITESTAFAGVPTGATVTNVETVNVLSGAGVTIDTSAGFSGLTTLGVTSKGQASVTAAATTDVTVTESDLKLSATSQLIVDGGKDVTVSATGTTNNTTGLTAASGVGAEILVGGTTEAAGKVAVTNSFKGGNGQTSGDVFVKGGTEVTVTQALTNTTVNETNIQGDVSVVGGASTTAVTVNQDATATAAAKVVGKTAGAVTIADKNAASLTDAGSIATVTLNNFGAADVNSGALTTLNLMGTGVSVDADTLGALTTAANNTLALNVDGLKVTGAAGVDIDDDMTTINIDSSNNASTISDFKADGVKTLNVAGDAKFTATANTEFTALETITVTNTAGAAFAAIANGVTFTGGAGDDAVTTGAAHEKAISMGAGNDKVTYGGVTSVVAGKVGTVDGGTGTDTVVMTAAQAAAADGSAAFNTAYSNFEVLDVVTGATTSTINLAGINGVQEVVTRGVVGANALSLDGYSSGGKLTLDGASAGAVDVNITNANLSSSDVFNITLENSTAAGVNFGAVDVADIDTLNITTSDKGTGTSTKATVDTLSLSSAGEVKSLTISGNNGLIVTQNSATKLTSFDASGVVGDAAEDTGALLGVTFTSANATAADAVSIKGGAGNDTLTGVANKDTIDGGAGDDIITGGTGIDVMTGGAGKDTFAIAAGDAGITSGEKITDFSLVKGGDKLDLATTTLVGNQTDTNVTAAVGGAVDVTATVKDGIITIGGADAALVDTVGEFKAIFELIDAGAADTAAVEFAGNTLVLVDGGAAVTDIIQLVGVTGASAMSITDAADTIFIA